MRPLVLRIAISGALVFAKTALATDTPSASVVQDRNLWMCPCPGHSRPLGNAPNCETVCFGASGGAGGTPRGGGMTSQQQLGMQMMQTMIGALFQPEDPAVAEQRRQRAELERQLRLQREAEERARIEAEHKRLEGELKLSGDRGSLKDDSLKRDSQQKVASSGDEIVLKRDAAPQLLRDADGAPEGGAKGHRIVDCAETRATRDRMQAGLPAQKESLDRTEKMLEDARHEATEASQEARNALKEAAVNESKELVAESFDTTRKTRALLERLSLKSKNGPKVVSRLTSLLTAIDKSAENVKKLQKAGAAGYASGEKISAETFKLSQKLAEANKLFVESGVAEELGEDLAKAQAGPLGALAFRAAKTSIDAGASLYHAQISASEAARAESNLATMREQMSHAQSRIQELEQDLAESCH